MDKKFQDKTEEFVFNICRKTFLSLWSYANPRRIGSNKELCDVLIVFEPHIIIFSVKNCYFPDWTNKSVELQRWWKKSIDDSINQIYGAERNLKRAKCVIRSDGSEGLPLPSVFDRKVLRISLSFGANGRIPIPSGDFGKGFIHIWDELFFKIVMQKLDTIIDLVKYLEENEKFAKNNQGLIVEGGEQNLLALYLLNGSMFSNTQSINIINGNFWDILLSNQEYQQFIEEIKISKKWDYLVDLLSNEVIEEQMEFGNTLSDNEYVLRYMARESRYARILLSKAFIEFIEHAKAKKINARMMRSPSEIGYIFFAPPPDYDRTERIAELSLRCQIARNDLPDCITVIGIGINVVRATKGFAIDACFFSSPKWTKENRKYVEKMRSSLDLFN